MILCKKCGNENDDAAIFCKYCRGDIEKGSEDDTSKQKEMTNCPNCGAPIKDTLSNSCPFCEYKFKKEDVSSSVKELILKLENIDSRVMPVKENKKSIMKAVLGRDLKSDEQIRSEMEKERGEFQRQKTQEKIALVSNFSVSNAKADILEFILLINANINIHTSIDNELTKVWILKLEQVYQKAELLMSNDSDFSKIKKIYDQKKEEIEVKEAEHQNTKKKEAKKKLLLACLPFLAMIVLLLIAAGPSILNSISNLEVREGQAKAPSGFSYQEGRMYYDVEDDFIKNGFTNIEFVIIDDLITGWLTSDGEVDSVSINGDEHYSSDDWYANDVEVVITYHTFPTEDSDDEEVNATVAETTESTRVSTTVTVSLRDDWISEQFDWWDGAHVELEKLIKASLNDEGSYKHIETTYVDINNQVMKDSINQVLIDGGFSSRVEINDIIITTEFSAKNSYNATIKGSAIAIASYDDDKLTVVSIG